jgi:transposase-like protein
MEKMRRARYKLEFKLEALRLIGAGQSIAAVAATASVTTPSVEVQSVPLASHHPRHASARKPSTMNNSRLRCLTTWEDPARG